MLILFYRSCSRECRIVNARICFLRSSCGGGAVSRPIFIDSIRPDRIIGISCQPGKSRTHISDSSFHYNSLFELYTNPRSVISAPPSAETVADTSNVDGDGFPAAIFTIVAFAELPVFMIT